MIIRFISEFISFSFESIGSFVPINFSDAFNPLHLQMTPAIFTCFIVYTECALDGS